MAARTKTAPVLDESMPEDEARAIYAQAKEIFEPDGVYTGADGQPLSLYARLAKIMAGMPEVKPEGRNQHFGYNFVTDKQVLGLVRPALARQRIVIVPETVTEQEPIEMTTQKGGKSLMTRLHVTFRVVDGINGESFTGEAIGYGDDSGDKGANKAYTAALKNFLIKLFMMGGADRDLEEDADTDLRAQARAAGVAPAAAVEVKETVVEGVARGGRSQKATEAQVKAVARQVQALDLDVGHVAMRLMAITGDPVELEDWGGVKAYLSGLSGADIGKVIEAFSLELEGRDEEARADEGYA